MSQLILVAPAAFKGTLGPRQVADALAVGARRALPDAAVLQCPISDGGDGLLDAVLAPAALRERRAPKAAARWRSWRNSTGGGVSPPGSSRLPTSPRRSSARAARPPCSGRRKGRGPRE